MKIYINYISFIGRKHSGTALSLHFGVSILKPCLGFELQALHQDFLTLYTKNSGVEINCTTQEVGVEKKSNNSSEVGTLCSLEIPLALDSLSKLQRPRIVSSPMLREQEKCTGKPTVSFLMEGGRSWGSRHPCAAVTSSGAGVCFHLLGWSLATS